MADEREDCNTLDDAWKQQVKTHMHILLVDDDPLVGRLLAYLLDDAGYTMTVLADPRRAAITREALIERTWGHGCVHCDNRVDVYIRRVRAKIEADPGDPTFIHTIRSTGYLFRETKRSAVA